MVSLMQYRAVVGLHNIYLKAKEYSNRMRGKFWSMLLFMFYMEAIYLPTLKRVIRSWQMTYYARLWFTQMCLYRFYIPLLIRLANDVETNPGPLFAVDSSKTVTADYHQGDVALFGSNAGNQCVAMCLTAVVYNYKINASWSRDQLNEVLIQGNVLYSHLSNSARKDFLLLSEIPSALSINDENFSINFSESFAGDLHMSDIRDYFVPLQHALMILIKDYDAFLLTIEINTVAIFIDNKGHYRIFDSHSRDIYGNLSANGTAILLEFTSIEETVQYLQHFYKEKNVIPYEVLGIKVKKLSLDNYRSFTSTCSQQFTVRDNTVGCKESCSQCHNLEWETESSSQENDGINSRKRKQEKSEEHIESLLTFGEKKVKRISTETESKGDSMSQKYREKYLKRKATETKEQRENRLRKCRQQRIKKKETESKEQRENRLRKHRELIRKKRETETKQQKENRLKKNKQTESNEQRERRLKKKRESRRKAKETETKQQKEERLRKRREAYTIRKGHQNQMSCDELVTIFRELVATGPTFVCTCCDQLWYKHSVVRVKTVLKLDNEAVLKCIKISEHCCTAQWVCNTCYKHLKQNKVPPCAVQNKMNFPSKPDHLDLTELEWRLVSPRLIFQKIHEAARGKQFKIHANIVNVPADVVNTVTILPRLSSETETIKVQLKRKLKYKNYVLSQNIRPSKVFEAAEWLTENGVLYQQEGIKLNPDWNDLFTGCKENDTINDRPCCSSSNVADMNAPVASNESLNNNVESLSQNREKEDSWNEVDESEMCAGTLDTMLTSPDFVEDCEREKVLNFAPGESNHPISVFKDQYCEELAYPGIFYGKVRADNKERSVPVYYSDICKSELRRSDRRVAKCIENIFFKLKKLQMKIILGKCQIALRKHKTKGKRLTAGELKKEGALDKLVHLDEGYRFLRALRGSPPYFEKAKKDLFAMIRQLGAATLFCSFSAAETKWNHLLRMLGELTDHKIYSDDELNALSWEEKSRLIQSDPITCARHFDFQVQQFIVKFLHSDCAPLGKIADWFYRVEFQQRGSPHIHMLLWIEGAPKFGEDSDEKICNFIDKIITCSKPGNSCELDELVSRQEHKHSFTCKKRFEKKCRFHFPQPPMKSTRILYPLSESDQISLLDEHKATWEEINEQLNAMREGEDISFDELLKKLGVTEEVYILAIRSSLSRATIFLKRKPNELRINNYNKHCLLAWRANMDVQFILDIYSCAMYVVSYISKAQRGMSELLRKACEEAREGNLGIKQQVRDIGNKFLNSVEISAQEAVYIVLQLPMRRSSREVVFINTALPDERVHLLKSIDDIQLLEDESEDIESGGLIKRYTKRPSCLENVTLADWAAWYDNNMKSNLKNLQSCNNTDVDGLPLEIFDHDNNEDDEVSTDTSSDLKTVNHKQTQKRSKARVIRSVWFNKESNPEKHYRELLMLFTAWRDENTDLLGDSETYKERCQRLTEQINDQMSQYAPCSKQLDKVLDDVQTVECTDDMWDCIAPNTQHVELHHLAETDRERLCNTEEVRNYDLSEDLGIPSSSENREQNFWFDELPDEEYREAVRSLNVEQLQFFYHVLHLVKTTNEPFYLFLSGGAGVGKSHLTKVMFQAVYKYLNTRAGDDFHQIKAVLVAPTGKAAYNIQGNTIHTALRVPANQSLKIYKKLDASRLNSLRCKFAGLKIIFIDEVSMVGNSMFNIQINKRLQDIIGTANDFGGVSIIAIGDLFQLQPVFDGYVFEDLESDYAPLAANLWQKHFQMFELHEIMRQRESHQFAEILNRLREGIHTENDLNILRARIIEDPSMNYPRHAPHLFIQNDSVDEFNRSVYNSAAGKKYIVKAVDSVIGAQSEELKARLLRQVPDNPRKTMQLATHLAIAENERIEVCQNIRLDDGLTNGSAGLVRFISLLSSECPDGIVWVEFDHAKVGEKTRNENRHLFSDNIQQGWTPIKPVCVTFFVGRSKAAQIVRKQFPLRPSAGKTIHRSQGDTETEVVVDLTSRRAIPHIHYVALSRVTTIDGLHIKNLNEKKITVSNKVKNEMQRLRTVAYLQTSVFSLQDIGDDFVKIVFLNARSLHKHISDVKNDFNIKVADVNIFVETRLWVFDQNDEYNINDFSLFRNDAFFDRQLHTQRPLYGTAVFTRAQCNDGYPKCQNMHGVEITIIKVKCLPDVVIAVIYRSPKVSTRNLLQALRELHSFMSTERFHIILGDFNIDFNNGVQKSSIHTQMIETYGYKQLISGFTTDNRTTIDHIYTNLNESRVQTGVLETYFSDHKAVWIATKKE
ncbi:uncharacterized protein LOC144634728 [Oculina patagonica]